MKDRIAAAITLVIGIFLFFVVCCWIVFVTDSVVNSQKFLNRIKYENIPVSNMIESATGKEVQSITFVTIRKFYKENMGGLND